MNENERDRHDEDREALWELHTGDDRPVLWTIDPRGGAVQGPLDLCFLAGRKLRLVLKPAQVGLLTVRGACERVWLDGGHTFNVGGGRGLPVDGMLYFMQLDRSIRVEWSQYIPVPRCEPCDPATRLASGSFGVHITDPVRFHAEMLSDRCGSGEDICRETLSRVMPTLLTIRLAHACGRETDTARQLEVIGTLRPGDLDPDLVPYGLACTALEVDTSFLQRSAPETVPAPCPD